MSVSVLDALPVFVREKIEMLADSGECWLWNGGLNSKGYGKFDFQNKTIAAHRFVYEQLVGAIPADLEIDHLCRVRTCVNPQHLEPVTSTENNRRARLATGKYQGCKNGHPRADPTRDSGSAGICPACKRAEAARRRSRGVPDGAAHGKCSTYNLGCRCELCRAARRAYDHSRVAARARTSR